MKLIYSEYYNSIISKIFIKIYLKEIKLECPVEPLDCSGVTGICIREASYG